MAGLLVIGFVANLSVRQRCCVVGISNYKESRYDTESSGNDLPHRTDAIGA